MEERVAHEAMQLEKRLSLLSHTSHHGSGGKKYPSEHLNVVETTVIIQMPLIWLKLLDRIDQHTLCEGSPLHQQNQSRLGRRGQGEEMRGKAWQTPWRLLIGKMDGLCGVPLAT